jgi:DNA polymerase-1
MVKSAASAQGNRVDVAPLGENQAGFAGLLATLPFREVWLFDFEFNGAPGDVQNPVCLVAWEIKSGRKIRLFRDEFGPEPPYPTDAGVLFVAYYASAELGCHLTLKWPLPVHVLDLFTEFRCRTNGLSPPYGSSLLGAMSYFGLDGITSEEKDDWRNLIMSGDLSQIMTKRAGILDYCEGDVAALANLLPHMLQTWTTACPMRCFGAAT